MIETHFAKDSVSGFGREASTLLTFPLAFEEVLEIRGEGHLFVHATKAVHEGDIIAGSFGEPILEAGGVDAEEGIHNLRGKQGVDALVEIAGLGLGDDVPEPFPLNGLIFDAFLLAQPVLKAAFMPVVHVDLVDAREAVLFQPFNDAFVCGTFIEHFVDALADGFGQDGDFALALGDDRRVGGR